MNAFGEALNLVFMRRSDALVPISQPVDLRLHSMSSYLPANESQTALPWVPIRCLWISDCIPMSSYSLPTLDAWVLPHCPHGNHLPKFLESFGWVPSMSCHPDSGMPIESTQLHPECDFGSTPIHTTWVLPKSIWEHFRAILRDFRFWLGFMRTSDSSMHDV